MRHFFRVTPPHSCVSCFAAIREVPARQFGSRACLQDCQLIKSGLQICWATSLTGPAQAIRCGSC
eukprot:4085104-Amphidinium_carterae.1